MFTPRYNAIDLVKVADLARFPEILWLHEYQHVPGIVVAGICVLLAGWSGLFVGFLWSTVLVFHAVFCINSVAHVSGKQRYVTGDDSRNNWLLAFFTMGEGWHNNHHAYQSSVRQGFRWWEIDPTYYLLRLLAFLGVVWDLKTPPPAVLRNEQLLGARVINRAAAQLAAQFDSDHIAHAIASKLDGPLSVGLRKASIDAHRLMTEVPLTLHAACMPTRDQVCSEAGRLFAKSRSLDQIVDRAYDLICVSAGTHLAVLLKGQA